MCNYIHYLITTNVHKILTPIYHDIQWKAEGNAGEKMIFFSDKMHKVANAHTECLTRLYKFYICRNMKYHFCITAWSKPMLDPMYNSLGAIHNYIWLLRCIWKQFVRIKTPCVVFRDPVNDIYKILNKCYKHVALRTKFAIRCVITFRQWGSQQIAAWWFHNILCIRNKLLYAIMILASCMINNLCDKHNQLFQSQEPVVPIVLEQTEQPFDSLN